MKEKIQCINLYVSNNSGVILLPLTIVIVSIRYVLV